MSALIEGRIPFFAALFGLLVLGPAVGNGASAQSAAAARPPGPWQQPLTLSFRNVFVGVGGDGSSVWQGPVGGDAHGRVTLALQQVESAADAANPVWHVRTRWTVETGVEARSFAAELEGMLDWRSGTVRLSGPITSGWLEGAWVQAEGRLVNGDVSGVLRILPSLATR